MSVCQPAPKLSHWNTSMGVLLLSTPHRAASKAPVSDPAKMPTR